MDWSIRVAKRSEGPAVADLNEVVQGLHHEHRPDRFKRPDAAAFLPTVETWLAADDVRVFVADRGDALVGYSVGVRHTRPETALTYGAVYVELDQVVVATAYRSRGVGRALCQAVVDWSAGLGVALVELGTWAFNDRAYELFEDLGFGPTVRRMSLSFPTPGSPRVR